MYNYNAPPGQYGRPPFSAGYPGQSSSPPGMAGPLGMSAPGMSPPGMSAPGVAPAPGVQSAQTAPLPVRPGTIPPGFQPPANLPNINFAAPVIRLGTTGPASAKDSSSSRKESYNERSRPGLGMGREGGDAQKSQIRDILLPPTREELARTIFLYDLPKSVQDNDNIERILRSAGGLRRWTRCIGADDKPLPYGFAEYEDAESLETAAQIFKDVQVPTERQKPGMARETSKTPDGDTEMIDEVKMTKLPVSVDEASIKYYEEWKARRDESEDHVEFRLQTARDNLQQALASLLNPQEGTQEPEGDFQMQDSDTKVNDLGEVVNIPLSAEDELSDIPAEMRETVASEIAAFRERSNRRDLERLKREEELERMERQRANRLGRSPPPSAPSGPAGGVNGVPLGPRGDRGVQGAPSGPKGYQGVQIPKDYQAGVSFVNGTANGVVGINEEDEKDTTASDSELERRRQEKKKAELDRAAADEERRWLKREQTRNAAVEREKVRDKAEETKLRDEREKVSSRLKNWNDDVEAKAKNDPYYEDRHLWLKDRDDFKRKEVEVDNRDRAAEQRENARESEKKQRINNMADDFLNEQAAEMEAKGQFQAPREPAMFKMSLGAGKQKAQPAAARRTIADIEGLLEDEEDADESSKRKLVPIKFDTAADVQALSDEERREAQRQLAQDIPSDKDGLWQWKVKWEFVDESLVEEKLKPFAEKKLVEMLGVQEEMLVDVIVSHLKQHKSPQELIDDQLREVLDEDAEEFTKKLWRMLVYYSEAEKRGLFN